MRATSTPKQATIQVKGSSIRSKLAFARSELGEQAEQDLLKVLRDGGVEMVLEASWYDYRLFDQVLRTLTDKHFGGDVTELRIVGHFSAKFALESTYRSFLIARDISGFLQRLSRLHRRYYDRGDLKVRRISESQYEICLRGQPYYLETDVQVAAGFYTGAAEVMGCRNVSCEAAMRSDLVLFDLRWET